MGTYLLLLKTRILPYIGDRDIATLKNADLQQFALSTIESGLSARSTKDMIVLVKTILRYAFENELIPFVAFNIKYPSTNIEEKSQIIVYTDSEQRKIIDYVINNPSPRGVAVILTLCTGMRIGELCSLTWKHVDIENRLILIKSTMQRVYMPDEQGKWSTTLINDSPKTSGSNRCIPIPSAILPFLRQYKKTVKDDYYVTTCAKNPTEPRTFRNFYVKLITDEVGLDRCLKFHGLRHTFATKMVQSGADLKTISSILGHSNVSITMNLYVHPTDANKSASMNKAFKNLF